MRNLKKVLSLALALVMLLGMMVVGAGAAADFKDADSIKNTEAVDVVSGIGVLLGDENKNFNPTGTLTRAEAAVVIAKLDLGEAFGNLATTNASTFTDVGANHWAKAYIDYCAARGLIVGSAGKFMPNDKVSGVQFALMVCRVLGYEDKAEGLNGGADWEVKAAALARKAGLTKDVTIGSAAMTRDEMAQVAFNALKADMVGYPNGTIDITVSGTPVTIGGSPAEPKNTNTNTLGDGNKNLQLAEEKFPQLKVSAGEDNFQRPSTVWTYRRDDIAETPVTAMAEYTAGTKGTTIAKALKVGDSVKADYFVDGKKDTTIKTVAKLPGTIGGNGVLTQAWYDEDAEKVTVTVINTYVGKVISVQKATSSADRAVTVSVLDSNHQPAGQLSGKYTTENFASGDVVLYTAAWNGTKYAVETVDALGEPATGTLTRWNGSVAGEAQNNFTVAGKQYTSNKNSVVVDQSVSPINGVWEFSLDKDEVNVYVDKYDYAIYVSGVEGTKNYAVVIGRGNVNQYGDQTEGATLLLPDGTQKSVTAKFVNGDTSQAPGNGLWTTTDNLVNDAKGDLVTYTVDDDNVYTLTSVDQYDTTASKIGTTGVGNGTSFVNGKSLLKLGSDQLYTTTNTLFFVCIGTGTNLTYTVYKGYNEMPGFDTVNGITGFAYTTNRTYTSQIDAIYVTAGQLADSTAANTYFVKTKDAGIEKDSTGIYFTLPAIVDGEETEIKLSASVFYSFVDGSGDYSTTDGQSANNGNTQGFYAVKSVKVNKNGIITSMASAMSDFNATAKNSSKVGTVASPGTVLGIGVKGSSNDGNVQFWSYNDKTKAFYVDKDFKTISTITVESIGTDVNDMAYAIATTGPVMLKEIVVVEDGSVVPTPPPTDGDSDPTVNPQGAVVDIYDNTITVDYIHGGDAYMKVAEDKLVADGWTITGRPGSDKLVAEKDGISQTFDVTPTKYFTVEVDDKTYYVDADGEAKGADAELELDLNASTYLPATKGTGYLKDIGDGDVYAAYAASTTKVKPKTDLFGNNAINKNIVVKTGYVKVTIGTDEFGAAFKQDYTVPVKTEITSAKGTGVVYDNKYYAYGTGKIDKAELDDDITLVADYVELDVVFAESVADGWAVANTTAKYIKCASTTNPVTINLERETEVTTSATAANAKYTAAGGVTVGTAAAFDSATLGTPKKTYVLGVTNLDTSGATAKITITITALGLA